MRWILVLAVLLVAGCGSSSLLPGQSTLVDVENVMGARILGYPTPRWFLRRL